MKVSGQNRLWMTIAGWMIGSSCAALMAQNPPPATQPASPVAQPSVSPAQAGVPATVTVPAGTKVLLSVQSAVNTKTAKPGDGIYLVSTFPVIIGSQVLIPPGVYVQGIIDQVQRPGRVKGRAKLLMHFTTMIFPSGQVIPIPGGVNNIPGSDGATVKNSEGQIEQAGNKGKDAENVGKGALAGAGLGTITGVATGSALEGAAYGGLAGAAVGGVYTLLTRGDDIMIPQGASIEMVLQRPLDLQPAQMAGLKENAPQYVPSASQQRPLPKPHGGQACPAGVDGCS